MTVATLDSRLPDADYSGGVSDPRLVRRLDELPGGPLRPFTSEEVRLVTGHVNGFLERMSLPEHRERERDLLLSILLGAQYKTPDAAEEPEPTR